MRLLLIFPFFFINIHFLYANDIISITKTKTNFKEFTLQMYEDKSRKLSFEEIQTIENFKPTSNQISEGYLDSNLWVKFTLKNDTHSALNYTIFFTETISHYVDCYAIDSHHNVQHHQEGPGYYIDGQSNRLDKLEFKLTFAKNEIKTIYIRLYAIYPIMGAFYLFDEKGLIEYTMLYNNLYSAYYGAIFSLLLYNFFLFLFSRRTSYLYYVLLITSYFLWQLATNSFFPFNSYSSTEAYYLTAVPAYFMLFFMVLFTRNLLEAKKEFPFLDKIMLFFASLLLFVIALTAIFNINMIVYVNFLGTVIFPFLLFVGFKSYYNKNKIALFFIIAEISFLTSSTVYSLMIQGILPYTLFTRHFITLGSLIELILFSFSLGYSIKLLQDEKVSMVSKAKRMEEEQQLLKQSRLAQMGEMLSMIAHQWRQPLSAISATSGVIELRAKSSKLDDKTAIKLASRISEYSQHLSITIDDFRNFFKPDKEKKTTTYNELIQSVLNIVEIAFINKNITLQQDLQSNTMFKSYPNEIKQVILNLLKNAEDVLLENKVQNPQIIISTQKNMLSIYDNGGGIEKSIIDKIFDPYFSTKLEKNGTGLGLYMSKIIIEEHCSGKLSVKNIDEGVVFSIILP